MLKRFLTRALSLIKMVIEGWLSSLLSSFFSEKRLAFESGNSSLKEYPVVDRGDDDEWKGVDPNQYIHASKYGKNSYWKVLTGVMLTLREVYDPSVHLKIWFLFSSIERETLISERPVLSDFSFLACSRR